MENSKNRKSYACISYHHKKKQKVPDSKVHFFCINLEKMTYLPSVIYPNIQNVIGFFTVF